MINRYTARELSDFIGRTAALLLAAPVLSWTTALAAIPDANGVIHGCVALKSGAVSIIDTAVTPNCKGNEVPIQWQAQVNAGEIGFQAAGPWDIDGNATMEAKTDGLLLLRYLLGIRGSNLVVGAVGNGCTRCTSEPIELYIVDEVLPALN